MIKVERNYIQPLFFQFGSDSIKLIEKVVNDYGDRKSLARVADFCSGCGVMGIELFCSTLVIDRIDFYERNIEFRPYIKKNLEMFYPRYNEIFPDMENVHFIDVSNIRNSLFDLIVCNPPYFYKIKNRVSENKDRRSSRFFLDLTFSDFVHEISSRLRQSGRGYLLYRAGEIEKEKETIEKSLSEIGRKAFWEDKFFQKTGLLIIS